eukprot:3941981-Rhodomonas_salina.2
MSCTGIQPYVAGAYAMPGIDLVGGASCLRARYSMPGTELAYGATSLNDRLSEVVLQQVSSAIRLRAYYAMPGTDIAPGAICPRGCTMSGTDLADGAHSLATPCPVPELAYGGTISLKEKKTQLDASGAVGGINEWYGTPMSYERPRQCPVLTWAMPRAPYAISGTD